MFERKTLSRRAQKLYTINGVSLKLISVEECVGWKWKVAFDLKKSYLSHYCTLILCTPL